MQVEGYRDSKQGFGGGAPRHSLPCCVSPLGRGSDPEQRVGQVAATDYTGLTQVESKYWAPTLSLWGGLGF